MSLFGYYDDQPKPYSFNGISGFWAVPAGRSWYTMTDSGGQMWVSPNELTRNSDGTVSGSPKYAADLKMNGTLVFMDALANRKSGIDSPAHDRLSPYT